MACRRVSCLPTSFVNSHGVLWALLLVTALIAGVSSSSSRLFDEEESAAAAVPAADLGDSQNFAVDGGSRGSLRTTDGERRENMKKLLLLALLKLAKDAREHQTADANDELRTVGGDETMDGQLAEQKRGRWQGFCFRKSRSGRIHPYICWKGSDF